MIYYAHFENISIFGFLYSSKLETNRLNLYVLFYISYILSSSNSASKVIFLITVEFGLSYVKPDFFYVSG